MNYIGSKYSILDYIDETIEDFVNPQDKNITFCDIFSGTSTVGKYFKKKGYSIIANDIQYYSYVTTKHLIENNDELKFEKLRAENIEPFIELNDLNGVKGFIYNNYSKGGTIGTLHERQYFSDDNAAKIDAIRQKIEEWNKEGKLTEGEYFFLIASLVESADKVANTASVYEAFLKHLKKSAEKPLVLKPIELVIAPEPKEYKVYNEDGNDLIRKISGDILYMDPPYNTRKYDTNYHILETIALYDNPDIKGKTGVRTEATKKSKFCQKKEATAVFEDMIKNANFKYILLSYNDEGIIAVEDIKRIMSKYGRYKCYGKKHKRFKADNKRDYIKDFTIEYIHCLEKKD